jgi:hypothetical protein
VLIRSHRCEHVGIAGARGRRPFTARILAVRRKFPRTFALAPLAFATNVCAERCAREAGIRPPAEEGVLLALALGRRLHDHSISRRAESPMKQLTRDQAIAGLRTKLLTLVDDQHSMCEVAARLHLFCAGFSQWKTHELKQRFDWIAKNRPGATRKEIEDLANRWQLARQFVLDVPIACDIPNRSCEAHSVCSGWAGFDDARLAQYYGELCGEPIEIAEKTKTG